MKSSYLQTKQQWGLPHYLYNILFPQWKATLFCSGDMYIELLTCIPRHGYIKALSIRHVKHLVVDIPRSILPFTNYCLWQKISSSICLLTGQIEIHLIQCRREMHFIIYSNSITLYEPIANYILIETAARGIVIVGNWNYKQFQKINKLLYRKK